MPGAVRGGVVARVGDLDVGPEAIEPHVLRPGELLVELGVAERGVEPVGVVVLVQRASQVDRPAVQQQKPSGDAPIERMPK